MTCCAIISLMTPHPDSIDQVRMTRHDTTYHAAAYINAPLSLLYVDYFSCMMTLLGSHPIADGRRASYLLRERPALA